MADSNKKVQPYTSFNAGEYSPELAGRVDLESFGSSSRFMSNMMSQVSGGVKKFYGTTHVAEVTPDDPRSVVKMVPFINRYEPMALVFWAPKQEAHEYFCWCAGRDDISAGDSVYYIGPRDKVFYVHRMGEIHEASDPGDIGSFTMDFDTVYDSSSVLFSGMGGASLEWQMDVGIKVEGPVTPSSFGIMFEARFTNPEFTYPTGAVNWFSRSVIYTLTDLPEVGSPVYDNNFQYIGVVASFLDDGFTITPEETWLGATTFHRCANRDTVGGAPVTNIDIGLIYGNNYKPLSIKFPSSININEMRWQQINDTIIFAHDTVQPLSISFYGIGEEGEYVFKTTDIKFDEVPYFPIGTTEDYRGTLLATGLSGEVTLSLPANVANIRSNFPSPLDVQGTYTRTQSRRNTYMSTKQYSVDLSTVTLVRIRNGVESTLCSGTCNSYTVVHQLVTEQTIVEKKYMANSVTDTITREKILQVVRGTYPGSYLQGDQIVLMGVSDHQDGDSYYLRLNKGAVKFDGGVVFPADITSSVPYIPAHITTDTLNAESWLGRKIKFYFDDDTVISPWWQGRSGISVGDYVYSNGHWYKATSAGTCGNIQPSHTFGTRSDGGVNWLYVHSGSGTATVTGVPTPTSVTVIVEKGELPKNAVVDGKYRFSNYAWSIWGYHGIHPSEVYMAGNRLGFVCNTDGYGAWNAMSVTDDYYNFSTEEYGEQLDTSAIVHLIANNESGVINWVLSRKNVYMGSFSGEYNIQGATNGVFTPTGTVVENISNMGGKAVIPLKYKELNMFVGITGKELYTIGYDYTIDDYTPHSLGYMTEHLMERGVRRIEALNNLDRNIYLLHDTNQLSLFNYAREQKIMGFSELDFDAPVIDYVTTSANDVVAGYVATVRNDGKITFERLAIVKPTYMWDTIEVGDGEAVGSITGVTHFAGKEVWVKYGDGQFMRTTLDENGDAHGVPMMNKYEIGLPMVAELHTQPAFGMKVEGHQQQSLYACLRLNETGSFEYGVSVDFEQYFPYKYWNNEQEWDAAHRLYTGDAIVNIPLGYAENANQGEGPYPNTTGVGVNLRSDTPEPFNLLSIQEVYK